jgi:hypothetical protein
VEEIRKTEGLDLEELKEHRIELLPDREEMKLGNGWDGSVNVNIGAAALAVQGAQAGFGQANQATF